ncbi:MAG: VIT1/CCC1 transporter family protein [Candidatus Gracilibacteria bacterium]|jgi:VIT1/CCC1 family predicted Fe2+/Mn2+ transporter
MEMTNKLMKSVLRVQQNEITEYHVYRKLAAVSKHDKNAEVLRKIADDEHSHYEFWKGITKREIHYSKPRYYFYVTLARIFGLTFGVRLMEKGEKFAQETYKHLIGDFPQVAKVLADEERHENSLIDILNSKTLEYTGSIILGLNDALVELTGALAGFTLALGDTKLIAIVGMITGIAASLSMAASQYLSKKEEGEKAPGKFAIYTGIAYIFTVLILVTPYFLLQSAITALAITMSFAVLVIFIFTFYTATARNVSFKRKFLEMAVISLGVAILNFGVGYLVKNF